MYLRIGIHPEDVLLIPVYMPASQYYDDAVEEIYEMIENIIWTEKVECCNIAIAVITLKIHVDSFKVLAVYFEHVSHIMCTIFT